MYSSFTEGKTKAQSGKVTYERVRQIISIWVNIWTQSLTPEPLLGNTRQQYTSTKVLVSTPANKLTSYAKLI